VQNKRKSRIEGWEAEERKRSKLLNKELREVNTFMKDSK
jgi:hypothetical protein